MKTLCISNVWNFTLSVRRVSFCYSVKNGKDGIAEV